MCCLLWQGMGEPLHNYAEVTRALQVLCHPLGLALSPNRVTVSTSGLVSAIDRLAESSPRPLLALSLNATTDEQRAELMPVSSTWGLEALRSALLRWPLRLGEKITIEYVLLAGVNDSPEDASRLASWVQGFRHNVNVIPFNEHDGSPFREPSELTVQRFVKTLQEAGCLTTVRRSRGRDVQGACGQLAVSTG